MIEENIQLLPNREDCENSHDDSRSISYSYKTTGTQKSHRAYKYCVPVVLLISAICNIALLSNHHATGDTKESPFLKIPSNWDEVLWWNTEYSGTNETEVDELWMHGVPWERGIIALSNEEANEMGLPDSQPWPWDSERKKIYIVNAHHILHCVRNLYISLQEYRQNKPQSIEWPHLLHCLDSIRQDTMCMADDTPRYVPLNSVHGFRPGDGQKRKCRNWDKMDRFVQTHDPCYKYVQPGNKQLSNLERFKYCPDNSQYLPKIRKYFGYTDDWVPGS